MRKTDPSPRPNRPAFLGDLFESLTERGLKQSWHRGRDWMKRHRPFGRRKG